jgi:putative transposase
MKWNQVRKQEFPWSYEVTKCAGAQAVLDVGTAFKNFFAGMKTGKVRYPKFKRKGQSRDSFALWNDQFRIVGNTVLIPGASKRKSVVHMREHLRFQGKILSGTVSRTADRWFLSVTVETPDPEPVVHPQQSVGIDLGIRHLAVLSHPLQDGTQVFENPRPLRAATAKLKRLQRGCSRQEQARKRTGAKKSKRAVKRQCQLARAHDRVACIRGDALHKLTTAITTEFQTVVVEDLHVAGMVRNHKLARSLADTSFGEIRRQLQYKSARTNGHVVAIPRFQRSTGVCPDCDYTTPERLPLRVRTWTCPDCNRTWDRDVAAAQVIHKVGTACPEPAAVQPTHGEIMALVAEKSATKPRSLNREPHRERPRSQRRKQNRP